MKKISIQSYQWRMTASFGNEKAVMTDVAEALEKALPHKGYCIHNVQTVLSEACINAIEYGNGVTPITIALHIYENLFELEVVNAVSFRRELPQSVSEQQIWQKENPRGWGMLLIRQLSDKVEYGYCQDGFYIRMGFILKEENHESTVACDDEAAK